MKKGRGSSVLERLLGFGVGGAESPTSISDEQACNKPHPILLAYVGFVIVVGQKKLNKCTVLNRLVQFNVIRHYVETNLFPYYS